MPLAVGDCSRIQDVAAFGGEGNKMSDMMASTNPGPPPSTGSVGGGVSPAQGGLLRVVPGSTLTQMDERKARERELAKAQARMEPAMDDLSAYVRKQFDMMRRHRDSSDGWSQRLVSALRTFNGEYEPDVAQEITRMGGSAVYARVSAVKCRAAAAMLRDIYLSGGPRPWAIEPSPDPVLPDNIADSIQKAADAEAAIAQQAAQSGMLDQETGQPLQAPTEEEIAARKAQLEMAARQAATRKAVEEAVEAEKMIDDILVEGGFYKAMAEFLMDLPLFPFAVIHGPVVYMTPSIKWESGSDGRAKMVKKNVARMFWKRISPFDIWWTPGASSVESADFIMRERKSRAELNALIDVPGYNKENLLKVLDEYRGGYTIPPDTTDSDRAGMESREDPNMNESGMFDCLMFHGSVQGHLLTQYGMPRKLVPDDIRDYAVQLWMIGRYVIKCQLSPSPRERPPFYISSYNKVPGTMVGNSVVDVLADIQGVCNATLRAMCNNMALASGPQVMIDEDFMSVGEDTEEMYPWKVWKVNGGRLGVVARTGDPVRFFQPNSNAQQLLGVYEKFTQIADEVSAIPRYVTGSERMGGAGRTASGLAMLMGNSSKMLQTVVANVDTDIFEPLLQMLYDLIMLTDRSGRLRGDERIEVKGVAVAMQRETERQRQIEMLQATGNPIDIQIMGMRGRAALLRAVAKSVGLDGEVIIPDDAELAQREKAAQAAALAQQQQQQPPPDEAARQAQGSQRGGAETGPRELQGPRVNLNEQAPVGTA